MPRPALPVRPTEAAVDRPASAGSARGSASWPQESVAARCPCGCAQRPAATRTGTRRCRRLPSAAEHAQAVVALLLVADVLGGEPSVRPVRSGGSRCWRMTVRAMLRRSPRAASGRSRLGPPPWLPETLSADFFPSSSRSPFALRVRLVALWRAGAAPRAGPCRPCRASRCGGRRDRCRPASR